MNRLMDLRLLENMQGRAFEVMNLTKAARGEKKSGSIMSAMSETDGTRLIRLLTVWPNLSWRCVLPAERSTPGAAAFLFSVVIRFIRSLTG